MCTYPATVGGTAVAFGRADDGACDIPPLPAGARYTSARAGGRHTVLLRESGEAVARGDDGADLSSQKSRSMMS